MTLSTRGAGLALCLMLLACSDSPLPTVPQLDLQVVTSAPSQVLLAAGGFWEDFSSPTLDPAWTVVEGTRGWSGYPPPANHFSLIDRPGYLRYYLNPMTHEQGFVTEYAPALPGHMSCCTHDPGLEIHREIQGDNWLLEAKVDYYMPYTSGRGFWVKVYFGNGGPGTIAVDIRRQRDTNQNRVYTILWRQTGTSIPTMENIEWTTAADLGFYDPAESSFHVRVERSGGVLSTWVSADGVTWTPGFSHDMGTELDGLGQRVVLTGQSWFNTAGSYADWDYVNVAPTMLTVGIDIKPGSDPNSINLGSKGTIPVAILSTPDFDATTVDPVSVTLADASVKVKGNGSPMASEEDVNLDGLTDLVVHVFTSGLELTDGDVEAVLEGETFAGIAIRGSDLVRIVP